MKKSVKRVVIIPLLFASTACSDGFKDTVGLRRNTPDEFKVVSNAPLSMPPEFTLRPPVAGAKRPQSVDLGDQAKNILFEKSDKNDSADTSKAESIFLKKADADTANPDIKNVLTQEELDAAAKAEAEKKKSFFSKINVFASKDDDAKADPVVNAEKEKERIAENEKEGKPVNDGDVAVVKDKKPSLLSRIFGFL